MLRTEHFFYAANIASRKGGEMRGSDWILYTLIVYSKEKPLVTGL